MRQRDLSPILTSFSEAIRWLFARSIYTDSKETHKNRDAILALPLEERRKALETMLGKPLMDDWSKTALLKKELILVHNGVRSTRYTFLLNGAIPFSGILYEKEEKPTKKENLNWKKYIKNKDKLFFWKKMSRMNKNDWKGFKKAVIYKKTSHKQGINDFI